MGYFAFGQMACSQSDRQTIREIVEANKKGNFNPSIQKQLPLTQVNHLWHLSFLAKTNREFNRESYEKQGLAQRS